MSERTAEEGRFEDSLRELEQVVRDLEEGDLGLDAALTRYEQGIGLVKNCHARLRQAEQRILLLTRVETDGEPVLAPFKHEATSKPAGSSFVRRRPAGES